MDIAEKHKLRLKIETWLNLTQMALIVLKTTENFIVLFFTIRIRMLWTKFQFVSSDNDTISTTVVL